MNRDDVGQAMEIILSHLGPCCELAITNVEYDGVPWMASVTKEFSEVVATGYGNTAVEAFANLALELSGAEK